MQEVPNELEVERNALIPEIYAAFAGVSRESGVSWSEAVVIYNVGSEEDRMKARESDTDRSWMELADNEKWIAGPGVGGWSFLDPVGFRYYLPAAMIKQLRTGHDAFPCSSLNYELKLDRTLPAWAPKLPNAPSASQMREHTLRKWSMLDDRQQRCVARFVRFMIGLSKATSDEWGVNDWQTVYNGYWKVHHSIT